MQQNPAAPPGYDPLRTWLTLAILGLIYILSFTDRFILALLIKPLKADLGLSDLTIGLLFGTVFAAFYGVSALPLARIADVGNRKWLIAACVTLWSTCTIASAWANSFAMLATLRFGLAVGEAALVPAAMSLLTDSLLERRRIMGLTLFSTAGMIGAAVAYVIGGLTIQAMEALQAHGHFTHFRLWQLCLVAVGIPGWLLALVFVVIAREPTRPVVPVHAQAKGDGWAHVKERGWLYPGLFLGAGFTQLLGYTMIAWGPTFLQRNLGMSAAASGYGFGVAQFVAAVGGTLLIPLAVRRVATAGRFGFASRMPAAMAGFGALVVLAGPFAGSAYGFLGCYMIGGFFLVGTANMCLLIIQPAVPANIRALLTACGMICISSLGLGAGPPIAAAIADAMGGDHGLGLGIAGVAVIALAGSLFMLTMATRPFRDVLVQIG